VRKLFSLLTLVVLTFCFAFPGLSYGQEEICGCYQKEHGQLRIVANPSECLSSEIPVFLSGSRTPVEIPSLIGT
jgi:hypothetical protein